MKYILGVDQSTQGTKAVLFDEVGQIVKRADYSHEQIVNQQGWVSHNIDEIYQNLCKAVKKVIEDSDISKEDVQAVGISNQRETTAIWNQDGLPLAAAVVWQCARASGITEKLDNYANVIRDKTGLKLSPYFPAAKMSWLLQNTNLSKTDRIHLGTMDSYLIYRLTNGESFKTDFSNASRTQLFNLHTLDWDQELCDLFSIPMEYLPEVCDSDSCFGVTDFDGYLAKKIPICGVMGDSHAALFGHGCHQRGMAKTTYGTGSSIMMHIGNNFVASNHGLVTSLAWSRNGRPEYVLEGNVNYTGAVISWLQKDLRLIESPMELESMAEKANPNDTTILVPAFSGLSAPYWNSDAKAMICGMSRTTGRNEIAKAALESIAFQITDVLEAMKADCSDIELKELCVDGGPAKNSYLMQFQSSIANLPLNVPKREELSAIGVAYMSGIAVGIYTTEIFKNMQYDHYTSVYEKELRNQKYRAWKQAVEKVL